MRYLRLITILTILLIVTSAWGADKKITDLPAAANLTGADIVGSQGTVTKRFPESLFASRTALNNYSTAKAAKDTAQDAAIASKATGAQGAKADNTSADEVYATSYNGGALTSATVNAAITAIGSSAKTLVLTPGAWAFNASVAIPANVTLKVQTGAVLTRSAGTLTINGGLLAPRTNWLVSFASGTWNTYFRVTKKMPIYSEWFDFAANGSSDDYLPMSAFLQSGDNLDLYLASKTYWVGHQVAMIGKGVKLSALGATIKHELVEDPLYFGTVKADYNSVSIAVTKNINHFTIPGGVTLAVGDMVRLQAASPYTTNYCYGLLTSVVAVSGGEAYVDILPEVTFTATKLRTYYPADNLSITGLTVDNSATTGTTHGISITGRNIDVTKCKFAGAPNAGIGLIVTAIGGTIKVDAKDYLNLSGSPSGAHYGDGMAVYGHNITISNGTITNCKHDISLSSPEFISSNIKVDTMTLTQNASDFGASATGTFGSDCKVHGALDTHPSLNGLIVQNSTITSAGCVGAVYVRSGNAKLSNNKITWLNTNNAAGGVIAINETQLSDLHLSDNQITAGAAGTPLVVDYGGTVGIAVGAVKFNNDTLANITWNGVASPLSSLVDNTAYGAGWSGDAAHAPSKDAVRAKIESLSVPVVSDTAYDATGWNGSTDAPTKNAVRDIIETLSLNSGTGVTSVGLSLPSELTVSNSPVTSSGALTASWAGQAANRIMASPSGSTGTPSFRQLTVADIPTAAFAGANNIPITDANGVMSLYASNLSNGVVIYQGSSPGAQYPRVQIRNYAQSTVGSPFFALYNSGGSFASNAATWAGQPLGAYKWDGRGATADKTGARLSAVAEAQYTDADQPTSLTFETGGTGTNGAPTEKMRLTSGGNLGIGATPNASYKLDVNGAARVSGTMTAARYKDTVKANGTCSTSINLDVAQGDMHTLTLSGACAIGITNLAAGDSFTVDMTQSASTQPVFQANSACTASAAPFACCTGNGTGTCIPYIWLGGTAPTLTVSGRHLISCQSATGTDLLCGGQ